MKFTYDNCGIKKEEIESCSRRKIAKVVSDMQKSVLKNDYDTDFSSIKLAFDDEILQSVENAIESYKNKIDYIILVGIGGSNLGTIGVYEAVLGKLYNYKNYPKILFADTACPDYISDIKNIVENSLLAGENVLINYVSKSGTTIESASNFKVFMNLLKKYKKNYKDYIVVTTDKDSKLWDFAKENEFKLLEIPGIVGGRFSVLSPVGLFPLGLPGIDLKKLLLGAGEMRDMCLNENLFENPAALSAAITYIHYKRGRNILVNFLFASDLEGLGKWLSQLIGESLGKEKNLKDEIVNVGITPVVSTAVDLHSMSQLYLAGPMDKFTNFVKIKKNKNNIKIPDGETKTQTLAEITDAIISGVESAYAKRKLPFAEITLEDKTEKSIGEFLQFKMMEIMFLAGLLEINAFNQPNVEEYKVVTRKILGKIK